MSAGEIRVGDIGTIFRATIKDQNGTVVDVSGAAVRQLIFRKSNMTTITKTATMTTDGTDGKIEYATVASDLNMAGSWQLQGYVEIGAGKWHSDIESFTVHANL